MKSVSSKRFGKWLFLFLLIGTCFGFYQSGSFLVAQKKFPRVRQAIAEKDSLLNQLFLAHKIQRNALNVIFVAFKKEKKLEVWAKNKGEAKYQLLQKYAICASSGVLGPKKQQGDRQVPEGIYYINRFNPSSSYYLSLGINYPNNVDKIRSKGLNPGGDIFIHGSCVTIG
jgi:murein L,D-transpeptidase YafK